MLNLHNLKLKTSIKIVAAFLVILQAVFLLQKVLAGPQSTLVVAPLQDKIGFNLTWSFANSDSMAKYFLLKSTNDNLSCPATIYSVTDIKGDKVFSGLNETVYDKTVTEAIVLGTKYYFKACLYGYGSVMTNFMNSYGLLEDTNIATAIFSSSNSLPTKVEVIENIATTSPDKSIEIDSDTAIIHIATTSDIANQTDTSSTATEPSVTKEVIPDTKKIYLSSVGKDLYWRASEYFSSGYYVLWSRMANPTYHSGSAGMAYFMDPLAKFYTVNAYDGAGLYYVRVCEALPAGGCGLYSNQLSLNLLADPVSVREVATTTITVLEDKDDGELAVDAKLISTTPEIPPIASDQTTISEPLKSVIALPKEATTKTVNAVTSKLSEETSLLKGSGVDKTATPENRALLESRQPIEEKAALKINASEVAINTSDTAVSSTTDSAENKFDNLPRACRANNILNETACNNYLFGEAMKDTKCDNGGDACLTTAREKYLNELTAKQLRLEAVDKIVAESATEITSVGALKETLEDFADIVSLRDEATGIKILKSLGEIAYQDNKIAQTGNLILVIDSDGDGLTDEIEIKLGTDPNNKDSDNDTYSDYTEYVSGHNPLGSGKFEADKLAPVEMAIINNETFEQPKNKGALHEDFVIDSIVNLDEASSSEQNGYLLQGKATPNTVLAIYIYSDLPLMITVKTDDYGNWKYELKQSLSDGEHEVYVSLNDSTGKVIAKSNPLSFVIREAKAASITDVVMNNAAPTIESETNNIFIYYLLMSGVLVLAGVMTYIYLIKRKRNSDV